jgi:hypothetical protein
MEPRGCHPQPVLFLLSDMHFSTWLWRITSEIGKQSSTRTLSHVIGHIQNLPNTNAATALGLNEPRSPRSHPMSVNQDGDGDQHHPGEYERPPAAKPACAAVAHVAHQGLHQEH